VNPGSVSLEASHLDGAKFLSASEVKRDGGSEDLVPAEVLELVEVLILGQDRSWKEQHPVSART